MSERLWLDDNEYARHYNAGYSAGQSNAQVGIDLMLAQARADALREAARLIEEHAGGPNEHTGLAEGVNAWKSTEAARGYTIAACEFRDLLDDKAEGRA